VNLLASSKLLTGEPVFTTGGRSYFWEDVILAGAASGDWMRLERELHCGMALLGQARAENAEPTRAELEAAITSFRYERKLISAQETRDWLARWHLRPDDWFDHLRRKLVHERTPNDFAFGDPSGDVPRSTPHPALYVDAVCSGTLEERARDLALRAACLALDEQAPPADLDVADDPLLYDDTVLQSACRLGVSAARGRERLSLLAKAERSYTAFRARALTPAALAREIASHALEWTHVACEVVTFDDQASAREALLCVRTDGRALREVAAVANRSVTSERVYLDERSSIADPLLGARKGDMVGPVAIGERFVVINVQDRVPASCTDPDIICRAESSIMSRLAASELAPAIQWQKAF
jgi:hypothetical protein